MKKKCDRPKKRFDAHNAVMTPQQKRKPTLKSSQEEKSKEQTQNLIKEKNKLIYRQ